MSKLRIGIVGGGIGGLSTALALIKIGHDVIVFEKTEKFTRVGADINLTPNAVHALDHFGIGQILRDAAAKPTHRISRMWDTGEETSRLAMGNEAEEKYGAPQLTIHRADLLKALENALPESCFRMGHEAEQITLEDDGAQIKFTNGAEENFDLLIGADGIHSVVRNSVFGPDNPEFTGLVSYRATFDRKKANNLRDPDAFTKWWGPESSRQIVTFPLSAGKEIFVFATTPQDDWREESWTSEGDINELRDAYADFHPDAKALLDACTSVTKSALYVRDPMTEWHKGRVTLLGDAAHPMTPFMAQGACQAIEDAVVLARSLENTDPENVGIALKRYENARKERTAKIQTLSRNNQWLKKGESADWLYGYDAWQTAI